MLRTLLLPEVLQLGRVRLHFLRAELPCSINDRWLEAVYDVLLLCCSFLRNVVLSSELLADLGRAVV